MTASSVALEYLTLFNVSVKLYYKFVFIHLNHKKRRNKLEEKIKLAKIFYSRECGGCSAQAEGIKIRVDGKNPAECIGRLVMLYPEFFQISIEEIKKIE